MFGYRFTLDFIQQTLSCTLWDGCGFSAIRASAEAIHVIVASRTEFPKSPLTHIISNPTTEHPIITVTLSLSHRPAQTIYPSTDTASGEDFEQGQVPHHPTSTKA